MKTFLLKYRAKGSYYVGFGGRRDRLKVEAGYGIKPCWRKQNIHFGKRDTRKAFKINGEVWTEKKCDSSLEQTLAQGARITLRGAA